MSTPIFDPEDPKLTAYALGELTDPAERAEVEQLLQHSPDARIAMKEIQDITTTLTAEYDQERHAATEPVAPITPNIVPLASHLPERRSSRLRPWFSIAALLVVVGVLGGIFLPVFNSVQVKGSRHLVQSKLHDESAATPASAATDSAHGLVLPNDKIQTKIAQLDHPAEIELKLENGRRVNAFGATEHLDEKPPAVALTEPLPTTPSTDGGSAVALRATPGQALATQSEGVLQSDAGKGDGGGTSGTGGTLTASSNPFQGTSLAGNIAQPPPAPAAAARSKVYEVNGGLAGKPSAETRSRLALNEPRKDLQATGGPAATTKFEYPSQFQPPQIAAAAPQPARVFRSKTDFYRSTDGLKTETLGDRLTSAGSQLEKAKNTDVQVGRDLEAKPAGPEFNTAAYDHLVENPFLGAKENQLSTFSIDVDTASYANVRRFLDGGSLPPPDAVRLEELINYFPYDYAPPAADSDKPFAVHLEAASCPWAPEHRLVRIGIKGKEIATDKRPASNLVFLIDVSGSMEPPERLPLIKQAMRLLVGQLTESDHVAIVTYAGNSGLALPSTTGDHKDAILAALDRLEAGGSTNGASGISLAYKVARDGFIKGGTNRVILATDGDFNVGVTSQGELVRLIQEQAKSGVFLSALGVGTDNYKDSTMQKLADKGNGNYNYIDRLEEARKVLVEQMSGTLLTIAKDVKIQVEFNPLEVSSYRLIGYEKRMLRKEDFNDDRIDAGEIGAGHSITALYEVVPVGQPTPEAAPAVDALKYDGKVHPTRAAEEAPKDENAVAAKRASTPPEMLTVKIRHKAPDADKSERTYEVPLTDDNGPHFAKASPDFKFAAAVATFGLALRDSPYKGGATLGAAVELAQEGKGSDMKGYRQEFIDLARRAQALKDAR